MMTPLLRCVFSSSSSSSFSQTLDDKNNTKKEKEKTLKFTTKIIVLGTNHTSSSDAEKVTRIIEDENPDVVVVELDFERLNSNSNSYKIGGKDFMNAVKSGIAIKQDPIVLLGDVKAKEIPEMLLSKATSV